jgi:hypothetical protein
MAKGVFDLEPEAVEQEPFSLPEPTPIPATPAEIDRDVNFYAVSNNTDLSTAAVMVQNNMTSELSNGAQTIVNGNLAAATQEAMATEGGSPEENALLTDIANLQEIGTWTRFLPPSTISMMSTGTPGATDFLEDRVLKLFTASEMIAEQVGLDTGFLSGIPDFAEILLDPFASVHNVTYRRLTLEFETLMQPGVSADDFEEGFQDILAQASDAGFVSENNRFYLGTFLSYLGNGIHSPEAALEDTLGYLDIFMLGTLDLAPSAVRAARRAATRTVTSPTATTELVADVAEVLSTPSTGLQQRSVVTSIRDATSDSLSAINFFNPNRAVSDEVFNGAVIMDDPSTFSGRLSNHTQAGISTPTSERGGYWSAPDAGASRSFEESSRVLDRLSEIRIQSGQVFDNNLLEPIRARVVAERTRDMRASGAGRFIETDVVLPRAGRRGVSAFDNLLVVDRMGKSNGTYFKTEVGARKAAPYGADVVLVGPNQWAYEITHNMPTNLSGLREFGVSGDLGDLAFYARTDENALGLSAIARHGSPLAQGDPHITSALFSGESARSLALKEVSRTAKSLQRGMSNRQINETFEMFDEMAASVTKEAYTVAQWKSNFYKRFNKSPTQKQVDLYLSTQEQLDVERLVTVDTQFKSLVNARASVMRVGGNANVVVVPQTRSGVLAEATEGAAARGDRVPEIMVWDDLANEAVPLSTVPEGQALYRSLDGEGVPGDYQFMTSSSPEIRRLYHNDIAPRNSGGHRVYMLNEMQHILKQRRTKTYADGSVRELPPRTMMVGRTREEIEKAKEQINNIIDAIEEVVGKGTLGSYKDGDAVLNGLRGYTKNKALLRAIQENSEFSIDIETVDDLIEFASDRGLDLRTKFDNVAEGERLEDYTKLDDAFNPGLTHGDQVIVGFQRGGRGTTPLIGYGGRTVTTRPAQESIEGAYVSSLISATEQAYRIRAGQGLILAADDAKLLDNMRGSDKAAQTRFANLPLRQQLEEVRINTTGSGGTDATSGAKLQLELERLRFRMRKDSVLVSSWNSMMRGVANGFYEKGFDKTARWADRQSSDPITAMRGLVFNAYLGMFNVSQLYMQGIQSVNIMAVGGVKGMQGTAMYPAMRFALANGHPAVIRRLGKAMQPVSGLTPDQFEHMVDMLRNSGRAVVDANVAENSVQESFYSNTATNAMLRGARGVVDKGQMFFREGELIARISSFNTSYLQYLDEFGNFDNLEHARRWMTWNDQKLTQAMTHASRQGYEQIPFFQFMTYSLRINEAIFAGTMKGGKAVLTKAEKARLAATHLAIFGGASTGATAFVMDRLESHYGVPVNEDAYRFARKGLLDGILSLVLETDTAVSTRLSSADGIFRKMQEMAQENVFTNLGGPSGEFTSSAISALWGLAEASTSGTWEDINVGLVDLARLTSSGNNTYNGIIAARYGDYLSRRGQPLDLGLNFTEAVFLAFGLPLESVDSAYRHMTQMQIDRFFFDQHARSISGVYTEINTAYRRGDYDRVNELRLVISTMYGVLEPYERDRVERLVFDGTGTLVESMALDMARRGLNEGISD